MKKKTHTHGLSRQEVTLSLSELIALTRPISIDIHDNTFHGGTFHVTDLGKDKNSHPSQVNNLSSTQDSELAAQLLPFFKNSRMEAQGFLDRIAGAKPTDITAIVNDLVKAGKIHPDSRFKPLWTVLHDADIYKPTERNWNKQVF